MRPFFYGKKRTKNSRTTQKAGCEGGCKTESKSKAVKTRKTSKIPSSEEKNGIRMDD